MRTRPQMALSVALLLVASACGGDYTPPSFPASGVAAQPLGQVLDLEVSLPHLHLPEAEFQGLNLELLLEVEAVGLGKHRARYSVGAATADWGRSMTIEDLGGGSTFVLVTPESWTSGRIGPMKIGVISFEMLLEGTASPSGRQVQGDAWESQTGLRGPFQGWSRQRFLLATTDFALAGRLAEVALVKNVIIEVQQDLGPVSGDPVVRRSGGGAFAINRLTFDNVQRLDPQDGLATAWQSTLGVGANPHDAVLLEDGRLWVSRYEPPFNDVAILDGGSGSSLGSVSLQGLAENPDGTPRPDRLVAAGGMLFVALQDIDRTFSRYGEGKLAVIDPVQERVAGIIPLGGKNPGEMEVLDAGGGSLKIYVALAGIFPGLLPQELSGGVVVVDVTNRAVERVALDDDDAGGNIVSLALAGEGLGYVVVADAAFLNRVLAFNPRTGEILRTVFETGDLIADIEVDGSGVLAIPDRSFTRPRVCLFRVPVPPELTETALGCADLEQAPFSLEALD